MREIQVAAVLLLLLVAGGRRLPAWQSTDRLAFEVVSIKPAPPGQNGTTYRVGGGRISGTLSLHSLIWMSYRSVDPVLRNDQIFGEPSWASSVFSITAAVGPDGPTEPAAFSKALFPMIKTFMEDRFKLAAHIEKREVPIYALVVARSDGRLGPKLHPVTDDECAARRLKATSGTRTPGDAPPCGALRFTPTGFTQSGVSMAMIASQLQGGGAGRPIIDRTSVAGVFDVDFEWGAERNRLSADGSTASSSDPTSLFTAVTEQLGLKLESSRESVDVLVVDHVEHPTEN